MGPQGACQPCKGLPWVLLIALKRAEPWGFRALAKNIASQGFKKKKKNHEEPLGKVSGTYGIFRVFMSAWGAPTWKIQQRFHKNLKPPQLVDYRMRVAVWYGRTLVSSTRIESIR